MLQWKWSPYKLKLLIVRKLMLFEILSFAGQDSSETCLYDGYQIGIGDDNMFEMTASNIVLVIYPLAIIHNNNSVKRAPLDNLLPTPLFLTRLRAKCTRS